MRPESGFQIALNWPEIKKMKMMSQFFEIKSSSNFFDVVEFLLSSLVTGPSFMSQFHYWFVVYKGLARNRKLPLSEFYPISEDWGELEIPNLAWVLRMKCSWMLQNVTVTVFIVSEVLRENQLGGAISPTHIKANFANEALNKLHFFGKFK